MIIILPLIVLIGIIAWLLRPGRKPTGVRLFAILLTVVPSLLVGVAAVAVQLLHNSNGSREVSDISNTLFLVGLGLTAIAILSCLGFAIGRKWDIIRGVGFGACISVFIAILDLGKVAAGDLNFRRGSNAVEFSLCGILFFPTSRQK
jgi:hypothetical protein